MDDDRFIIEIVESGRTPGGVPSAPSSPDDPKSNEAAVKAETLRVLSEMRASSSRATATPPISASGVASSTNEKTAQFVGHANPWLNAEGVTRMRELKPGETRPGREKTETDPKEQVDPEKTKDKLNATSPSSVSKASSETTVKSVTIHAQSVTVNAQAFTTKKTAAAGEDTGPPGGPPPTPSGQKDKDASQNKIDDLREQLEGLRKQQQALSAAKYGAGVLGASSTFSSMMRGNYGDALVSGLKTATAMSGIGDAQKATGKRTGKVQDLLYESLSAQSAAKGEGEIPSVVAAKPPSAGATGVAGAAAKGAAQAVTGIAVRAATGTAGASAGAAGAAAAGGAGAGAAGAAAGGAGAGLIGAAGAGLAGLAASLGPVTIALGALTATVIAYKAVQDSIIARAQELQPFSGAISKASAQAEVRQFQTDRKDAEAMGGDMGRLIDSISQIESAVSDILRPFKEEIVDMFANFAETVSDIFKFLNDCGLGTLLKIAVDILGAIPIGLGKLLHFGHQWRNEEKDKDKKEANEEFARGVIHEFFKTAAKANNNPGFPQNNPNIGNAANMGFGWEAGSLGAMGDI